MGKRGRIVRIDEELDDLLEKMKEKEDISKRRASKKVADMVKRKDNFLDPTF